MFDAAVIAFLVVPILLGYLLSRTRVFWLPAAGLAAFGVYLLATVPDSGHGEASAAFALGSGFQVLAAIAVFAYALVVLAIAGVVRSLRKPRSVTPPAPPAPPPEPLPVAVVR